MALFTRIGDWFDDRTCYRRLLRAALDEPVPGGARWSYIFGSALVILISFQVLSGFLLSLSYSPGTDSAHASVKFIMEETTLGWLIRSLHKHGSSFIITLLFVHCAQVFIFGAYKRPRELNWVTGIVLGLIMFTFGFTGYLLPWDQRAYWSTQVGTSIMGSGPVVGPLMQAVVQGGREIGNLTLTRFYSIHIFLLPVLGVICLSIHLWLFRRQGVTPSASTPEGAPAETFWPKQVFRDTMGGVGIVVALFVTAILVPAQLGEPADPSVSYPARPEWFFLFLFQLLKYFEGPYEVVGTAVLPGLLLLLILIIPFLDRGPSRSLRHRKAVGVLGGSFVVGWVCLTGLAYYDDYASGHFEELKIWEAKADPDFDTEAFYAKECRECHGRDGAGYLDSTPDFTDGAFWGSVRSDHRLVKAILEGVPNETIPQDERMNAFGDRITPEQSKALVERKVRTFFEESE